MGLLLAVAQSSSAVLAVTLLMLIGDLAPALLAPLTGVIADRMDLRRLMMLLEVGQAAATAAIAVWLPALPVLLALFLVRAVLGQVFQPATRAAVPALVGELDLTSANVALGFGENGLTVAGPLLAAVLVVVTGIRGLLFIDAASFCVSAFLLLWLPRITTRVTGLEQEGSFLLQAAEGITFLWRTVAIRLVFLSFFVIVLFNAVDDVALVFLGRQSLHARQRRRQPAVRGQRRRADRGLRRGEPLGRKRRRARPAGDRVRGEQPREPVHRRLVGDRGHPGFPGHPRPRPSRPGRGGGDHDPARRPAQRCRAAHSPTFTEPSALPPACPTCWAA